MFSLHNASASALLVQLILLFAVVIGCEQPVVQPSSPPRVLRQVIAFTATWCGPCKGQAPIVDQIEATGINLHRIDIDQRPDLAQRYGVTAVPTYFLFEGRRLVTRTNEASTILQQLLGR
jgi:thiol-disulfide isomerase/thioredoxin